MHAVLAGDRGVVKAAVLPYRRMVPTNRRVLRVDDRGLDVVALSDREDLDAIRRRRVRTLEQERDILKKAAAFFAKETGATP